MVAKNTMDRLITKSFKRLLDKGIHRGFITYEELGKSLGKRHYSQENIEKAFLYIFDNRFLPHLIYKDLLMHYPYCCMQNKS